ncbi:hypothetical protein C4J99_0659 [Pseudomonas synxantha]|nr:hypothetical protein C4J99_0659 [Pseudomonas synxantha]
MPLPYEKIICRLNLTPVKSDLGRQRRDYYFVINSFLQL